MSKTEFNELILKVLKESSYQPLRSKALARHLGVAKDAYRAFRDELRRLGAEGKILRGRGGVWYLPDPTKRVIGRLSITRSGAGFLIPEEGGGDDLFLRESSLGAALNGDRVAVELEREGGHGLLRSARVVEVLERASPRIVAFVNEKGLARPEDPKNPFDYRIIAGTLPPADHKILFEITTWPGDGGEPAGKIIEILGPAGEPDTETAAILAGYNAPGPFPEEVKQAVRNLKRPQPAAKLTEREDLTELVTFTIDPVDARDYDDALSIERREDGTLVVGVHIADVSAFVKPGSPLDVEARTRSTSIYLPGRVIPMLPEELSNDLCSLRPDEEHLTKTVFLHFDAEGKRIKSKICRSVIRSQRRFTYEEVYALLTQPEAATTFAAESELNARLLADVQALHALAQRLRERRLENGAIELNMPEFRVVIDEAGHASDIIKIEHDSSHQLVEDFMLAANIALAEWCRKNGMPVLYRAHASPGEDSVTELAEFLTASGYPFKPPLQRSRLNAILEKVKGKPEEHAINLAILKSFMQAIYQPDPETGHFALNFPNYMHFTSPIRRYPDLHLHQMLDAVFSEGVAKLPQKLRKLPEHGGAGLERLGVHTSGMERRAMKIEEAVKDFRRLELLSRQDQREFVAVVTGVRKFGLFLEIEDYFVEGMIPRWMVEKAGFSTREEVPLTVAQKGRRKKRGGETPRGFHLGQEVKIRITKVDLAARLCEMELIGLA